jgi:hypothetical protein
LRQRGTTLSAPPHQADRIVVTAIEPAEHGDNSGHFIRGGRTANLDERHTGRTP